MSFDTEYLKLFFIDKGGGWGFAVMHIRDSAGVKKLRLAKCKKEPGFPKMEKWIWQEVDPELIKKLKQRGKINFRKEQEIEICFQKLNEELEA